ncbi:MAG: ACP S-malonyltransferase [Pirellulales bacterium]
MGKTAFLFPGQGAQTVGMGRTLYDTLPAARQLYDQANGILGYDLAQMCFDGPAESLDSTVHSQPALFVTSLAALESLKANSPDVVAACQGAAGLSLGEYTALVFASAIDFEAGLRLVQRRGQAMQEAADATPSGMVSIIGLDLSQIDGLCQQAAEGQVLQIANLLCPGTTVVSGANSACERIAKLAEAAGAMKVSPLPVAGAFHTPIMHPADQRLAEALSGVEIRPPKLPVVSNVDAVPHDDPEEIRTLLVQQLISQVRWEDSIRYLLAQGFDSFYEVGPGRALRTLLKRIDRKTPCVGVME